MVLYINKHYCLEMSVGPDLVFGSEKRLKIYY